MKSQVSFNPNLKTVSELLSTSVIGSGFQIAGASDRNYIQFCFRDA